MYIGIYGGSPMQGKPVVGEGTIGTLERQGMDL